MLLSNLDIDIALREGEIDIRPLNGRNIQPASYDLTLGDEFLEVDQRSMAVIKPREPIRYRVPVRTDNYVLHPGTFVLATTMEEVCLTNRVGGFVEGRSSIGRIGLFIQNAGWIDPGFRGQITLELFNANPVPIELSSGLRICQIVFCATKTPGDVYAGKYVNQKGVVGSRSHQDR